MKNRIRLAILASLIALAGLTAFSGCNRQDKQMGANKMVTEYSPEAIGLGTDAESLGQDKLGRYWYKATASGPGTKEQQWMFDPHDKTLYTAIKDEQTGEWILKVKPEVTAESLGLGAGTKELGKDANGRFWFVLAGGEEHRVYLPKTKELRRAAKNARGEWDVGPPVSKP